MSILDLKNMTIAQKIMAMEELWADLDKTAEENGYNTPQWHKDILNEREEKVKNGNGEFSDFHEAKKRLQSRLDNFNADYNA